MLLPASVPASASTRSVGLWQQPQKGSFQEHCRSEGGRQNAEHVKCSLCQNVSLGCSHCSAKPPGQFSGASLVLFTMVPWLSPSAQVQSQGQGRMCFALDATRFMDLPLQTALCTSSKPWQIDRRGLDGILVFRRPQELQGGTKVCAPKAGCGLLAPPPLGDVVFRSVLLGQ